MSGLCLGLRPGLRLRLRCPANNGRSVTLHATPSPRECGRIRQRWKLVYPGGPLTTCRHHSSPSSSSQAPSSERSRMAVDAQVAQLFDTVKAKFDTTQLGGERWYLFAIACLAASPDPEAAGQLYLHLIQQPAYATSTARQALVRRLREALIKAVPLVGVCKPIEAIVSIIKVERPEDRDYSCTREGWQCDAANHERGMDWFRKVYTRNATDTMGLFDAHKDFAWVSADITYGLFLSDRAVLDDVDTQMVVWPAIMLQNLRTETHWHIRGTRRIGVSKADVQTLWGAAHAVAAHYGMRLDKVPTVEEVEPDV